MAIICENCGLDNPEDALTCAFCGTALPPKDPSTVRTTPLKGEGSDEEVPEWLRRIRMRSQEDKELRSSLPSDDESDDEFPDWLRGMDFEPEPDLGALSSDVEGAGGEGDDWLAGLRGRPTPSDDKKTTRPSDLDTPDWLKALSDIPSPAEDESGGQPPSAGKPGARTQKPYWQQTFPGDEEYDANAHPASEIPDWLKDLAEKPEPAEPTPLETGPLESDDDQWKAAFTDSASGFAGDTAPGQRETGSDRGRPDNEGRPPNLQTGQIFEPPIFSTDDLNWLMDPDEVFPSFPLDEEEPDAADSSAFDQPISSTPDEEETAETAGPFTSEEPQSSFLVEENKAEETAKTASPFVSDQPLSTESNGQKKASPFITDRFSEGGIEPPVFGTADMRWLKDLEDELEDVSQEEAAEETTKRSTSPFISDFLPPLPAEPPVFSTDDLNLLKEFEAETPFIQSEEPSLNLPQDQESGWVGEELSLPDKMFVPPEDLPRTEPLPPLWEIDESVLAGQREEGSELEALEGLPDWLNSIDEELPFELPDETQKDVEGDEIQESAEEKPAPIEEPSEITADEDLAWLSEIQSTAVHLEEEQQSAWDLKDADLSAEEPEADLSPEPEIDEQAAVSAGILPGEEPPEWVQAMRPLGAGTPVPTRPVAESRIETGGPLAGFKGLLPAEDLNALYRPSTGLYGQLAISERQRAHVTLLEELIASENQPQTAGGQKQRTRLRLARVLAGLMLLVIILVPLLTGFPAAILPPEGASPFVFDFYEQVSAIPQGKPVLVAADFQAAYAGEMRFAATNVLVDLMSREQPVAVVSSLPNGPLLADDLLRSAQRESTQGEDNPQSEYDLAGLTTNLGYLPGGMTSLLEFALAPRQAAPGFPGSPGWEKDWLQAVSASGDFGAVIVLTDSVEIGRAWIEQVQPSLGETPLLLISSAQAAPLLAPYAESGQVEGLISGLAGGASYGRVAGGSGYSNHWNAYQIGIIAAISLMLAGALLQRAAGMFSSAKPDSKR